MYRSSKISKLILCALFSGINIAGSFIAASIKLPIYLDSIGTLMSAILFGPWYAICTGMVSGLISGITFDIYSFYFIPSQIVMAFCAGIVSQKGYLKGLKIIPATIIITIPSSIVASMIAAYVFNGITSSGSSYIVQILSAMGIGKFDSVLITQMCTDYIDKLVAVLIALAVTKNLHIRK